MLQIKRSRSYQISGRASSTYVVSKVGLSALTRIQHREMVKDSTRSDIAINHVHPGWVSTDMSSHKGNIRPDEGAKSALFASMLPLNTDIKGQYIWKDCSILDWVNGPEPE
jgi:carbonyl reductase 1